MQLRGELARQVRAVVARFGPASCGRLTFHKVVLRAVDAGLTTVIADLLAGAEHALATPTATEESAP